MINNDEELDAEVARLEEVTSNMAIAPKHEIMIQFEGRREIVTETYANADYLSAAIKRTEELELDPTVRFYVVILKIIGAGVELEEIMMVRDMVSLRAYNDGHLQ